MNVPNRADARQASLLVIDIQERLLPAIHGGEAVVARSLVMIEAARILAVPIVWTEQYVKGLGRTDERVRAALKPTGAEPIEKLTFSCCDTEPVTQQLRSDGREQVVVIGIESHVCVQQTVLDLLRMNLQPFVLADAVGSRRPIDYEMSLHHMRQAGAVTTTTEAIIFEMLREAGTEIFKSVLKVVK